MVYCLPEATRFRELESWKPLQMQQCLHLYWTIRVHGEREVHACSLLTEIEIRSDQKFVQDQVTYLWPSSLTEELEDFTESLIVICKLHFYLAYTGELI